jgi:hypothetical protein
MVPVPVGVEGGALIVSVDVPEAAMEGGFKLAVTPDGNPATLNETWSLKPFCGATVKVTEPEEPGPTVN